MKLSSKTSDKLYSPLKTAADSKPHQFPSRSLVSNLFLILLSAGLVIWSLRFLKTRLTSVVSVDAVVNAPVMDIKAPGEGVITAVDISTGEKIAQGQPLLTLKPTRVNAPSSQASVNQIGQQRSQLKQAQERLASQLALLDTLVEDEHNQGRLEVSQAQQSVDQFASELKGADAQYRLAKLNYQRTQKLKSEGAIAQASLDAAEIDLEKRRSEVNSLEARLSGMQVNKEAVERGLSLSKTRSNYDPRIRRQELELQISDQRQIIQTLERSVKESESSLAQTQKDASGPQQTVISAPTSGVLWQLSVSPGRVVQPGEFMGKIVDCDRRWVDAVVEESAMRTLKIGDSATVELYANQDAVSFQGKISLIRSGLGRVSSPGEDITGAVDLNLPRHTQVRIALDTIDKEKSATDAAQKNFCYVGYTGKVALQVQQNPLQSNPLVSFANLLRL